MPPPYQPHLPLPPRFLPVSHRAGPHNWRHDQMSDNGVRLRDESLPARWDSRVLQIGAHANRGPRVVAVDLPGFGQPADIVRMLLDAARVGRHLGNREVGALRRWYPDHPVQRSDARSRALSAFGFLFTSPGLWPHRQGFRTTGRLPVGTAAGAAGDALHEVAVSYLR